MKSQTCENTLLPPPSSSSLPSPPPTLINNSINWNVVDIHCKTQRSHDQISAYIFSIPKRIQTQTHTLTLDKWKIEWSHCRCQRSISNFDELPSCKRRFVSNQINYYIRIQCTQFSPDLNRLPKKFSNMFHAKHHSHFHVERQKKKIYMHSLCLYKDWHFLHSRVILLVVQYSAFPWRISFAYFCYISGPKFNWSSFYHLMLIPQEEKNRWWIRDAFYFVIFEELELNV